MNTRVSPKRIRGILPLLFLLSLLCALPSSVQAGSLAVRSAIIMDMKTGRILYEQNADDPIAPASLTKILSMYVVLEEIESGKHSLDEQVRISKKAANTGGSRMFIRAGERVSMEKLLMGMAISSGNDASVAVAEHIAGSTDQFVRLMNQKARSIGMKNSRFVNVNGLPAKKQQTTARDMLCLAQSYIKQNPKFTRYHSAVRLRHNKHTTTNKNPLLGTLDGADGLKTGWVNASGYNLICTASRDNNRLIGVVLGAPNQEIRGREASRLMETGFQALKSTSSVASLLKDPVYVSKEKKATKKQIAQKKKKKSKQLANKSRKTKKQASKSNAKKQTAQNKTSPKRS